MIPPGPFCWFLLSPEGQEPTTRALQLQGGAGLPSEDPKSCAGGRAPHCSESAHLEAVLPAAARRGAPAGAVSEDGWQHHFFLPHLLPEPPLPVPEVEATQPCSPQVCGSPQVRAEPLWGEAAVCTSCCPTSGTGGLSCTAVPTRIVVFTEQRQDVRRPVSAHYLLALYF